MVHNSDIQKKSIAKIFKVIYTADRTSTQHTIAYKHIILTEIYLNVESLVLKVMNIKRTTFSGVLLYSLVEVHRSFEENAASIYRFDNCAKQPKSEMKHNKIQKIEALRSSETSVNFFRNTRHHVILFIEYITYYRDKSLLRI
jgi:hypothetical protein